jgi:hypothetical protein
MSRERRLTVLGVSHHRAADAAPAPLQAALPDRAGETPMRRDYARWPFELPDVRILLRQPGGGRQLLALPARNLSCSGIALLHRAFVHPDSEAELLLRDLTGAWTRVTGHVIHSDHRGGMTHNVGIRFSRDINVRSFVRRSPASGLLTYEKIRPAELEGHVAVVEPDRLLRETIKAHLRRTNATVHVLDALEDLQSLRGSSVSVVLFPASAALSSAALLRSFRAEQPSTGLVVRADALEAATFAQQKGVPADMVMPTPFDEGRLYRTLAEFLLPLGTPRNAADAA